MVANFAPPCNPEAAYHEPTYLSSAKFLASSLRYQFASLGR